MITFKHEGTTFTCRPENEEEILVKLWKLDKRRTFKTPQQRRRAREFPQIERGMSTAEYLEKYAVSRRGPLDPTTDHRFLAEDCVNPERLKQPAPTYVPFRPLCEENTDE